MIVVHHSYHGKWQLFWYAKLGSYLRLIVLLKFWRGDITRGIVPSLASGDNRFDRELEVPVDAVRLEAAKRKRYFTSLDIFLRYLSKTI